MTGAWIAAFVATWILVIVLSLVVLGTLRRLVPVIERAEATLVDASSPSSTGLPLGTIVPAFAAAEIGGDTFTDAQLRGSTTIMLFLGSSCEACERFVRDLRAAKIPDIRARLVVIADSAQLAHDISAEGVTILFQEGYSLTRIFDSDRVPHAFIIGESGRVQASGWPNDWESLDNLLQKAEKGGGRDSEIAAAAVAR
jgi:hypothetical protein